MMHRAPWMALLLVSMTLAGCIGTGDDLEEQNVDQVLDTLTPRTEQLWTDLQTAPHPSFDYPTLTTVPEGAPEWWQPIPSVEVPADVTGVDLLGGTGGEDQPGTGIAVFGSLAIIPGRGAGTTVYDISDPAAPEALSHFDAPGRDVDVIAYPDGRLVAVLATDSGFVPIWDITDPTDPQHLLDLEPPTGSHNVLVVPGTPILYNANSAGDGLVGGRTAGDAQGQTEIYDLTDPANPVLVEEWQNGFGCHDITTFIDAANDRFRAYCAGIQMTQIWDIQDPLAPEVVSNIPVHHGNPMLPSGEVPLVLFSHLAMVNDDGTTLIVGDETGGGAAPGCDAPVEAAGKAGPLGNIWLYDITDEQAPELMGWWSPPSTATNLVTDGPTTSLSCTAHFGRIIPHAEDDLLAIAFYSAGVWVLDITDPAQPFPRAQFKDGSNTWDVWFYNGHLFTGDMNRGMDVLTLTGS